MSMQKLRNAFRRNRKTDAQVSVQPDIDERQTFILPFVVVSFLLLPLLGVIAFSKTTVSFRVLVSLESYAFIQAFFWLMVPLTVIFAVLYMIRAKDVLGRILVAAMTITIATLFLFIQVPR